MSSPAASTLQAERTSHTGDDAPRYGTLRNYIGGKLADVEGESLPVHAPATGAVIAHVPLSGAADVDAAVRAARAALPAWSALPIKERVQVFFRYRSSSSSSSTS